MGLFERYGKRPGLFERYAKRPGLFEGKAKRAIPREKSQPVIDNAMHMQDALPALGTKQVVDVSALLSPDDVGGGGGDSAKSTQTETNSEPLVSLG